MLAAACSQAWLLQLWAAWLQYINGTAKSPEVEVDFLYATMPSGPALVLAQFDWRRAPCPSGLMFMHTLCCALAICENEHGWVWDEPQS